MANALEIYLEELSAIRSSGAAVRETSGYPALANLFNAIGHTLKPKVRCFIHVKNSGAGLPDGGLFTFDQLKNTDEEAPLLGIPMPSRGVKSKPPMPKLRMWSKPNKFVITSSITDRCW